MEDCYITRCATAIYEQKYMEFLLEHYNQLNLPYSFSTTLSFISSPVLLHGEIFLVYNGNYEVIGAFGFIHGTGANQYNDTEIVQIQIAYLVDKYRGKKLFVRGLQYLAQYIAQSNRTVKELRFWSPADQGLRRLFDKIAERSQSVETIFGEIDKYATTFSAFHTYVSRFRPSDDFQL